MIKKIVSTAISLSILAGGIGNVISGAAASGGKYYLRSDYAVSTEGVISDNTKVDSSTGEPQIDIEEGTTAKIVVNTTDLSAMSSAVINYAQSGGTLDIKLTALENAEDEAGVELANTTISAESGYDTRSSDPIAFINTPPESAEYMKVELSVSGSKDGKSYINYVELSDEVIKIPSVVVWRSISNGNVLDIEGSGTANGDIVTASAAEDSKISQHWTIQETDEKRWNIIVNKNSGKGMGLLAGTTAPGAEAVQWTIDGSANQLWRFVKVEKDGNTYYKILNKNSKLVLTALGEKDNYSLTQQLYKHTDDQLWTLNLVGGEWNDPTWDTAEADENGTAIIYQGNGSTDYRCGVIYGRGLQLQADPESEYYGKIYATSEYYQSGRWDGNEHFRFYESSDNGETWQFVGDLYDTENNREKYKGSMWSMRHQPDLYELPEDLGDLKKGTIICAGLTTSNDTTAKTDSDYDGSKYTRIDLYYSTDGCRSWSFLGHVTDGGESRCGYASAIWEPYLYMADGKLYCFYSDERGIDGGQKLVAQYSSDGKTWSNAFDVVNFTEENESYRPGMPIVTQMSDGRYVIVYEEYAMNRDGSNKLRSSYKITDDIENWNADEHGTIMPWSDGGSPYITTMNDGTLVCGNMNSSDIYINTNNLSTNE